MGKDGHFFLRLLVRVALRPKSSVASGEVFGKNVVAQQLGGRLSRPVIRMSCTSSVRRLHATQPTATVVLTQTE
jgi:hypothetical protein